VNRKVGRLPAGRRRPQASADRQLPEAVHPAAATRPGIEHVPVDSAAVGPCVDTGFNDVDGSGRLSSVIAVDPASWSGSDPKEPPACDRESSRDERSGKRGPTHTGHHEAHQRHHRGEHLRHAQPESRRARRLERTALSFEGIGYGWGRQPGWHSATREGRAMNTGCPAAGPRLSNRQRGVGGSIAPLAMTSVAGGRVSLASGR
jgi:hypothetical protein